MMGHFLETDRMEQQYCPVVVAMANVSASLEAGGGGGGGGGGGISERLDLQLECSEAAGGELAVSQHSKDAAFRVLRATTPGWRDGDDQGETEGGIQIKGADDLQSYFSMQALTGGTTNAVFRCSKPGGTNRTVLLRSYGKGTEMYFSRESELKAVQLLAQRGLGPAVLATFEDGRVEEFLDGRALHAKDMRRPEISTVIARRLAELHALDLDGVDRDPLIFRTLEDFHRKALDLCGDSLGGVDIVELGVIIARLRRRLEQGVPSKRVFCHNDLQPGNIMYNIFSTGSTSDGGSESGRIGVAAPPIPTAATSPPAALPVARVCLIDYEYSGYNPRGFDLGNHFCEWMADYEQAEPHLLDLEKYPSAEEKRRFCRAYLGATLAVPDTDVSLDETESLVSEADAYSLASHLLWGLWALLQSKSGAAAPGFDYVKYAAERVTAYRHFVGQLLPAAATS